MLLPKLTVESNRTVGLIAGFLVPYLHEHGLAEGVEIHEAADFLARMVLSYISSPGTGTSTTPSRWPPWSAPSCWPAWSAEPGARRSPERVPAARAGGRPLTMRQLEPYCLIVGVARLELVRGRRRRATSARRRAGGRRPPRSGCGSSTAPWRCLARQAWPRPPSTTSPARPGCSRATVYRVFPGGKDGVLGAVVDTEMADGSSAPWRCAWGRPPTSRTCSWRASSRPPPGSPSTPRLGYLLGARARAGPRPTWPSTHGRRAAP